MLTTLRVSGFAIVDRALVRFGEGLNVLTGETGAGKSILVDALHLVLGGRMTADVLRDGADEAVVEAVFDVAPDHPVLARLDAAGIPRGDGELLVRRVAARSGRGRAFVNGALCTVGMLETVLAGLVDVTGQHEHVGLLDEGTHLALLDAFAAAAAPDASAHAALVEGYRRAHAALAALAAERALLEAAREERTRRADYLAFQLRELDAARPRAGEDAELERERQVLASTERLAEAARAAEALAYGEEGSAAERVGRAARALEAAAATDPRLEAPLALLRSGLAELEEAGRALARYAESIGGNPDRLAAVEERLDALRALARKHGGSLAAALERAEAMRAELAVAEGSAERLAAIDRDLAEAGARAAALATDLSRVRAEAARRFSRAVKVELDALAMRRCDVQVELPPAEGGVAWEGRLLAADGAERARILIAPNPGEAARPLARVASGGELSRVLLAVKRALARADPVDTYVLDEVDAGLGGGVAEAVGRLLAEIGRERQVICVTHLPQVAAFADHHFRVEKRVAAGRTSAAVVALGRAEERRAEVARMLAGSTVTPSAIEHASALIACARNISVRAGRGEGEPKGEGGPVPSRGRRRTPSAGAAARVARRSRGAA
jgi:DNA repair protein RecN (Recombination protein N)